MENWLKQRKDETEATAADNKVRDTVEGILRDISYRGDEAVRDLSIRFDKFERDNYRLSEQEIEGCLSQLIERNIEDIKFSQTQVRNFARKHWSAGIVRAFALSKVRGSRRTGEHQGAPLWETQCSLWRNCE